MYNHGKMVLLGFKSRKNYKLLLSFFPALRLKSDLSPPLNGGALFSIFKCHWAFLNPILGVFLIFKFLKVAPEIGGADFLIFFKL